ncbi:hypothetical protein SDRG_15516 [Saprolegnia diclina VS20]|uniref:Uncharacterized protein n=1 Tax=Saprolegnia diclina (strain VS20) TaxID=1156394 RepID=T0R3Q0_SAPDV|nr:hypothetical protein SDRG_15516 [Saprolegnia diclina VS20]EQC26678.1 hypothetical protein SDRG_15516 [Saprolegnia diclina VS20]|eukprot:XP_008619913.1 hypothetical protein SDRG_15516 [Saprolegnia diclina VS20]
MPTAALPEPLETGPHRISMTKVRQATKGSMLMTDADVAELLDATDAAPRVVAECEKKNPAKAPTPSRPPAPAPDAVPETVPSVVDGVAKIDVLSAAEQRRSERTQFIQILERAYELQTSTKAQTKRFGARDAVERAVELYRSPRECAISDYIETTLDPAIHEFFEPYMTARAPLSASEASSYWWRRLKLA